MEKWFQQTLHVQGPEVIYGNALFPFPKDVTFFKKKKKKKKRKIKE